MPALVVRFVNIESVHVVSVVEVLVIIQYSVLVVRNGYTGNVVL